MHDVSDIPFFITISENSPYLSKDKTFFGKVSAAELGVSLTAIDDDHVEYRSPFGGATTVRYLRKGLLGIHILYDSKGAHHWPSVEPGSPTMDGCWSCKPLGCDNEGCGGQGYCNGHTCPTT